MAHFDFEPVSGHYHIRFRYGGRPFKRSLRLEGDGEAGLVCALVDETIKDLKRGRLLMPSDAEPGAFILSGGKLNGKPTPPPKSLTIAELLELYAETHPKTAKEKTTRLTERIHRGHLIRVLGGKAAVESLTSAHVQRYADKRSNETYRGRPIKPDTIRKELSTLRVIWNWGVKQGQTTKPVPFKLGELSFARTEQRQPFRTAEEIRAILARGGLDDCQESALWECLYLRVDEVHEVLALIREQAAHQWIYPMMVFAAMTGARRSEICRARIEDFDFHVETVTIRERKRVKGRNSFRIVDLNPLLTKVMQDWFSVHPGGPYSICQTAKPLTVDQAHDHLKRTLRGSPWQVIAGFHTFRHSFASNLAAAGVDEATIDSWMGHQTAEQRKRYRHLFPQNRKRAIDQLSPEGTDAHHRGDQTLHLVS